MDTEGAGEARAARAGRLADQEERVVALVGAVRVRAAFAREVAFAREPVVYLVSVGAVRAVAQVHRAESLLTSKCFTCARGYGVGGGGLE